MKVMTSWKYLPLKDPYLKIANLVSKLKAEGLGVAMKEESV